MVAIFTGEGAGLARSSANILGGAGQVGSAGLGRGGDRVSVNGANGNLVITRQDEFLVGLGPDASISRTYNSIQDAGGSDRDNGDQWQQSTTKRILAHSGVENQAGSTIKRLGADGSVIIYTYEERDDPHGDGDAPGGLFAYWTTDGSGSHDRIEKSGSSWKWVDGDSQVTETYSVSVGSSTEYRLTEQKNTKGRKLTFSYVSGEDKLDKVSTNNGEWLKYTWSGNQISKIETGNIDGSGVVDETRTYYEYDGSGRLNLVRTDLTPEDGNTPNDAQSYWIAYAYDGTSGRIAQITQKDGSQLDIAYDVSGRVVSLTQKVDATTTRITAIAYFGTYTLVTAPDDSVTRLEYDSEGQLTKIIAPPATTGATAQEVVFAYDGDGNVTSTVNAAGEQTAYAVDERGNTETITTVRVNDDDIVVTRSYDDDNNLILQKVSRVVGGGAAEIDTYSAFVYDTAGRLMFEVDSEGHVREYGRNGAGDTHSVYSYTEHTYNDNGWPTGTAPTLAQMNAWRDLISDRSSNALERLFYDARGAIFMQYNFSQASTTGVRGVGGEGYTRIYYTYDQAGKLLATNLEGESASTFTYDGMGRMLTSSDPASGTTSIVFNDANSETVVTTAGGYVVTKTYNQAGELIAQTGANGGANLSKYDEQGRLRYHRDEENGDQYYIYDKAGRLVGEVLDGGQLTEFHYDDANRLVATTKHVGLVSAANRAILSDPDNEREMDDIRPAANAGDIWAWTVYDDVGRVVQTIDGDGGVTAFTYDDAGQLLKATAYFEKVSVAALKVTLPTAPVTVTSTPVEDAVTRNFYDRSGRRTGTLDGEGYLTEIIYDDAGRVVETIAYAEQAYGSLADATRVANWGSHTLAQLRSDVDDSPEDNRRAVNVYDGQGLVRYQLAFQERDGSNDIWQVTQLVYENRTGHVTQSIARNNTLSLSNSSPDFTYDAIKAGVTSHADDRSASSTYDSAGRVATTTDASGLTTSYTYDVSGNVIKTVTGTGDDQRVSRSYYSAANFLVYAVDSEGYVTYFDYDLEGKNTLARSYDEALATSVITDNTTLADVAGLVGSDYVERTYTYDKLDRVQTAWLKDSGSSPDERLSDPRYYGTGLQNYATRASYTDDQSQNQHHYDGAGRLTRTIYARTDVDANVYYYYDGQGNQVEVRDARNESTYYEYDRRGQLTKVTDAEGGIVTYEYNAFGDVVKATDAEGGMTYSFYDDLGRIVQVVDAEGYVTTTSYTAFGDVETVKRYELSVYVEETGGGELPANIQAAYAAAATAQTSATNLDSQAASDAAAAAALQQEANNLAIVAADYLDDANAYQAQVNGYNSQLTTDFNAFWSAVSNSVSIYQADFTTSQSSFNYYNNLFIQAYSAGNYVAAQGYALQAAPFQSAMNQAQSALNAANSLLATQGNYSVGDTLPAGNAHASSSAYAATLAARNSAQVNADAAMADYNTANSAAVAKQNQANSAATTATQSASAAAAAQAAADQALADAQALEAAYHAANQGSSNDVLPAFQLSELGAFAETSFEYDVAGQLTKTIDAEGYYETYTYNAFGQRATVNAKSESQTASHGSNNTTTYMYDRRGQLVAETLPVESYNNSGTLISSTVTNTYEYDSRGNRTKMIQADGLTEELVTEYVYDKASRLIETKLPVFLNKVTSNHITYDGRGNVTSTTNGAGNRSVFYYDDLDRKVVEISPTGTYTKYTYDKNSNVTQIEVFDNTVSVPADGGSEEEAVALGVPSGNSRVTTFTYDALNRMTSSTVVLPSGYQTGELNVGASVWVEAVTADLTTEYEYDSNGNVVKTTDPNGNVTYAYYDNLGRKTAQVDTEKYLTTWEYNSEGNVTKEKRYTNKVGVQDSLNPNENTSLQALTNSTGENLNDRVTVYSYDLVGNRLSETRYNVAIWNAQTNTVSGPAGSHASVSYLYNGLGQVVRKAEATGEQTNYKYDDGGRLIEEKKASFTSHQNTTVTPEVDYYYNGRGDLARTVTAGAGDAAERVTQFRYDGDKLRGVTDAEGWELKYDYDEAGRLTYEFWSRHDSTENLIDGGHEGVRRIYDDSGRIEEELRIVRGNNVWLDDGPRTYTTYNAHGDVVSAKVGTGSTAQTQNKYDAAGRLWATNAGDGVWKFFGYDKNGNQTIAITSAGEDLTSIASASDFSLGDFANDKALSQVDVNATYTAYDARNLATKVVEEGRQLSGSSTADLSTVREYNSFGEVAKETDALGNSTTYTYNAAGRMIRSVGPTVQMTREDGTTSWIKPTEDYYYDASGRLVAQRDANGTYGTGGSSGNGAAKAVNSGNLTKLTLLAGTGYDGSEALVAKQINADGSEKEVFYDVHGDAREIIDELDRATKQTFDKLGRVLTVENPAGLITTNEYDELGQKIRTWNSHYGSGDAREIDYDALGRVTRTREIGGDIATTTYTWDGTLEASGSGLTDTGGWTTAVTAEGYSTTNSVDLFGRDTASRYIYDIAGRLKRDNGTNSSSTYDDFTLGYYNTGKLANKISLELNTVTDTSPAGGTVQFGGKKVYFTYDEMGRLKTEKAEDSKWEYHYQGNYLGQSFPVYQVINGLYQDGEVTYDALGRITNYVDHAQSGADNVDKSWKYDANGNVRSIETTYRPMSTNGAVTGSTVQSEYWYRYDNMNRITLSKGVLSSSTIVAGSQGIALSYDDAGQRKTSKVGSQATETYTYNNQGLVTQVKIGSTVRSTSSFDILGRMNGYVEKSSSGALTYERHSFEYNSRGQILAEKAKQKQGSNWRYTHVANYYNDDGASSVSTFPGGLTNASSKGTSSGTQLYYTQTKAWLNGSSNPAYGSSADNAADDTSLKSYYQYKQESGWRQSSQYFSNEFGTGTSVFQYGPDGSLERVERPATSNSAMEQEDVSFFTDANGQVIRRWETFHELSTSLPRTQTYRFGGKEMGTISNNGTGNTDYVTLIDERDDVAGNGYFRNGDTSGTAHADFDANHRTLASGAQGGSPGSHVVREGDTLQGLAAAYYGDANLWYKIAQANGVSMGGLSAGQRLSIPQGVNNNTHNASSFTPYDPAKALGDVHPPAAAPPKADSCGIVGHILLSVIAIAATAIVSTILGPAGSFLGGVALGAISGAAGAAVQQGFGVATGAYESFSFKSVALAGISGGLNGGISGLGSLAETGKIGGHLAKGAKFLNKGGLISGAVRSAASSAATQGIGVATGLQSSFSWAGVAAAGVAGGISGELTQRFNIQPLTSGNISPGNIAVHTAVGAASLLGSAATRSAIEGTSFGANIKAGLPDVIGQVLGEALMGTMLARRQSALQTQSSIDMTIPTENQVIAGDEGARRPILDQFLAMSGHVVENGKIVIDEYFEDWLEQNSVTDAELRMMENLVTMSINNGSVNASYDFGYLNDDIETAYKNNDDAALATLATERANRSVVSLGDDKGATVLALAESGILNPDDALVNLVLARANGDTSVGYNSNNSSAARRAENDIEDFLEHRADFTAGLARTAAALNRFQTYGNLSGNAGMIASASDMRAAMTDGHFLIMPQTTVALGGYHPPRMEQLGVADTSVINIFRQGINQNSRRIGFDLFHELWHTTRNNSEVGRLEGLIINPNSNRNWYSDDGFLSDASSYISQARIANGLGYRLAGAQAASSTSSSSGGQSISHRLLDDSPLNGTTKNIFRPLDLW